MSFVFGSAFLNSKNRLEAGGPLRNELPPSLAVNPQDDSQVFEETGKMPVVHEETGWKPVVLCEMNCRHPWR